MVLIKNMIGFHYLGLHVVYVTCIIVNIHLEGMKPLDFKMRNISKFIYNFNRDQRIEQSTIFLKTSKMQVLNSYNLAQHNNIKMDDMFLHDNERL